MEWVFGIMVVSCLFDIEEKLKKIINNNQENNNQSNKTKNKKYLEQYINKKVSITIDNDDISDSYLFSSSSNTIGEITNYDDQWFSFKYYDKLKKSTVNQYIRIKDLVSIDEIK